MEAHCCRDEAEVAKVGMGSIVDALNLNMMMCQIKVMENQVAALRVSIEGQELQIKQIELQIQMEKEALSRTKIKEN